MEGDCEENRLLVVEPAEVQTDLLSAKALVKSTEQIIVLTEAVINIEQPPKPAEMSVKDQNEFDENVKKWVAGLAAPERNKAKKLLKRYACAFATNNKRTGRADMVKHETTEARSIKQSPRSIPLAKCNEVKELVDEMKRSGVIEPSSGP